MARRKKRHKIKSGRPESLIEKVGHGFVADLFFKHAASKFKDTDPLPEGETISIRLEDRSQSQISGFYLGNACPLSYTNDQRFHWSDWLFCENESKFFIDEIHGNISKEVISYVKNNNSSLRDAELFELTDEKTNHKSIRLYATNEFVSNEKPPNFNFIDLRYKYTDGLGRKKEARKIGISEKRYTAAILLLDFLWRYYSCVGIIGKLPKNIDEETLRFKIRNAVLKNPNTGTVQNLIEEECADQISHVLWICKEAKNYTSFSDKILSKIKNVLTEALAKCVSGIRLYDGEDTMVEGAGLIDDAYSRKIKKLKDFYGLTNLKFLALMCSVSPIILSRSNMKIFSIIGADAKLTLKLITEFTSLLTDENLIFLNGKSGEEFHRESADFAQHISCIPSWEKTGRRIIYVSQDVVSPFLKTSPPSEYFKIEQPTWGVAAYFQFEWPSNDPLNPNSIKNHSYTDFQSLHKVNLGEFNASKTKKIEVDGAYVTYHPHIRCLRFDDPSKEGEANDFLDTFDYAAMVSRGEITIEEALAERDKTYQNFGAKWVDGPIYQVDFFIRIHKENGEFTNIIQQLTLFEGISPHHTKLNTEWGQEINTKLISLMMNILYSLNRTKIIEVKSIAGRRARSIGKLKNVVRWTEAPYTQLSMDTTYKQVIRKSYTSNQDENGEPTHRKKPHRRDPHWGRVWVLGDNMADWELPDAERVHPTSGNTHYRVSRLFQGSYINGTELDMPRRKTEVRIKKWKPKTSKESA